MPLQITGISATSGTIAWCRGRSCQYPTTGLRFTLNRATTVRLVLLRTRIGGHFTPVATATLQGHRVANRHRIAGRWHNDLYAIGLAGIRVQIQRDHRWTTAKTIDLTVRHTYQRR